MRRSGLTALALFAALLGPAAAEDTGGAGHEAAMQAWAAAAMPGAEHEGLAELVGSWAVTTRLWMAPGTDPQVTEATAERGMIFGGRVLEEQFSGEMDGRPFQGRATTGFDNVTGRYWGTWIDTVSTGVTLLYGGYDDATGLWIMEGDTPDPLSGGTVPMRIESRRDGPDRHIDTFYMPAPDGTLVRTMEMVYERR